VETKQINKICNSFKSKYKSTLLQGGLFRFALLLLGVAFVSSFFDWLFHFPAYVRWMILISTVGGSCFIFWWSALVALKKKWSNEEVLAYLDVCSEPENKGILELHELIKEDNIHEMEYAEGKAFVEASLKELDSKLSKVSYSKALNRGRMMKWMYALAAVCLMIGVMSLARPKESKVGAIRFFNPLTEIQWPSKTKIDVYTPQRVNEDGSLAEKEKDVWRVPQLEPFKFLARVYGEEVPSQVTLHYKSDAMDYWVKEKINVNPKGGVEYEFPSVQDPIEFYLTGGDYQTFPNKIEIIERPFIRSIQVKYEYPPYAGVPNKTVESGQLSGLEGTKVIITFVASMELQKAVFNLEGVGKEELNKVDGKTFVKEMLLEKSGSYNIELYEASGFREARLEKFEIQVTPDELPTIDVLSPGENLQETKNAAIRVSFECTDDFGLEKVEVFYKVGDGEDLKYQILSNKITGPLRVEGKKKKVSFKWDFAKMDIPETGTVYYYVQVKDINPTGNGVSKSLVYEMELVDKGEFHAEAVLKAKALLTEGRLAWRSQLDAYSNGLKYNAKGINKVEDPIWNSLTDQQGSVYRAVQAMKGHIGTLTDKFTRNRMQKEFMSVRLNEILGYINNLSKNEVDPIRTKMKKGDPKTDSDAAKVKTIRSQAYGTFKDHQKMGVLYLERILRKLYDWRDLQDTSIKTHSIQTRQSDVFEKTKILAPKLIGKDRLDLSDEEETELIALGKIQKSILDAESSLEKMLVYTMFKAKKANRKSIQKPIDTAHKILRRKQVNNGLKRITRLIENNQSSMVTKEQEGIVKLMSMVKDGLIAAGQKLDPDGPLNLNMNVSVVDLEKVEEDPEVKKNKKKVEVISNDDTSTDGDNIGESFEDKMAGIKDGDDPLSLSIQFAIDTEDKVLARIRYMNKLKSQKGIMPRFLKLKNNRVEEIQVNTHQVIDKAVGFADKEKRVFVSTELKRVKGFFKDTEKLIKAKDTSETHARFIESGTSHLSSLIKLIAHEKDIGEMAKGHIDSKGKDAFGRMFLAQVAGQVMLRDHSYSLFRSYVYQKLIDSTLSRFSSSPAKGAVLKVMEGKNRTMIATLEGNVKTNIEAEKANVEKLAEPVKEFYKASDGFDAYSADIAKIKSDIEGGKDDKATSLASKDFMNSLATVISSVRDILEERVKEKEKIIELASEVISEEDWAKKNDPAEIAKQVLNSNLPQEQKDILLRSLKEKFPSKYKDLLASYFRTILEQDQKGQ